MSEQEQVLLAFKIYKKTRVNRAWFMALIDSILNNNFEEKLKQLKKLYFIPDNL